MRRRAVPALCLILASLLTGCAPSSPAGAPAKSAAAPAAPTAASAPPAAGAPSASAPVASAPAAAPAPSAALQALIDAARREGQLNLVWAESVLGGSQMAPRLAEGFNKLYGLNLNVQFT